MLRKMNLRTVRERLTFLQAPSVRYTLDLIVLLGFTAALSLWLNIRYPIPMALADHFTLALEVPLTLGAVVLARRLGLHLRWWAFLLLGALTILIRLFHTADNISHRFLYRDFHVILDKHLIPEFFKLLYDSSPARAVVGYSAVFIAFVAGSIAMVALMLGEVHRRAQFPFFRRATAGLLLVTTGCASDSSVTGTSRPSDAAAELEAGGSDPLPDAGGLATDDGGDGLNDLAGLDFCLVILRDGGDEGDAAATRRAQDDDAIEDALERIGHGHGVVAVDIAEVGDDGVV